MIYEDYHVHTTFSDGKHSPEEMVQEALRRKMKRLGFSDHSYTSFDLECGIPKERLSEYRSCIRALQEKYRGQIEIFLGIEQDYYSDFPAEGYDYVIGSVHYVKKDGEILAVDMSPEDFVRNVEKYYGGDYYGFVRDYYELVGNVVRRTGCSIIGHFDLVTKFNEGDALFSTTDERYLGPAFRAIDRLLVYGRTFEVNTGAVYRGYRKTPYPSAPLLQYILDRGGKTILSSDSHRKEQLMYGFETLS